MKVTMEWNGDTSQLNDDDGWTLSDSVASLVECDEENVNTAFHNDIRITSERDKEDVKMGAMKDKVMDYADDKCDGDMERALQELIEIDENDIKNDLVALAHERLSDTHRVLDDGVEFVRDDLGIYIKNFGELVRGEAEDIVDIYICDTATAMDDALYYECVNLVERTLQELLDGYEESLIRHYKADTTNAYQEWKERRGLC